VFIFLFRKIYYLCGVKKQGATYKKDLRELESTSCTLLSKEVIEGSLFFLFIHLAEDERDVVA